MRKQGRSLIRSIPTISIPIMKKHKVNKRTEWYHPSVEVPKHSERQELPRLEETKEAQQLMSCGPLHWNGLVGGALGKTGEI